MNLSNGWLVWIKRLCSLSVRPCRSAGSEGNPVMKADDRIVVAQTIFTRRRANALGLTINRFQNRVAKAVPIYSRQTTVRWPVRIARAIGCAFICIMSIDVAINSFGTSFEKIIAVVAMLLLAGLSSVGIWAALSGHEPDVEGHDHG